MNVRQIVIAHLKDIGADGLCCDGCGCGGGLIMPCNDDPSKCIPATWNGGFYSPIDTPNEPEETHL